jgi:hypothetical protein
LPEDLAEESLTVLRRDGVRRRRRNGERRRLIVPLADANAFDEIIRPKSLEHCF